MAASLQPPPGNTKINGSCSHVPGDSVHKLICTDTGNRFTCTNIVSSDLSEMLKQLVMNEGSVMCQNTGRQASHFFLSPCTLSILDS